MEKAKGKVQKAKGKRVNKEGFGILATFAF